MGHQRWKLCVQGGWLCWWHLMVAPAGWGVAWLKLPAGPNLRPAAEQSPSPVLGGALGALLRQPELITGLG